MKYRVFLCEHIHPKAYALLQEKAEILSDPAQLPLADAAINRNLRMDRRWLEGCPNLKVIGIHGTGTDGVDLAAAAENGIRVIYAPGENARSVAELIPLFALSLSRHVPEFDRQIQSGQTPVSGGGTLTGQELYGKTFGVIGFGRIGQQAARIMREGFGMQVCAHAPSLTPEKATALGADFCSSPEAVFEKADIVSLCVPMNDSTKGMVNSALLSHAKPGCILINTARGGIMNEADLYQALTDGRIAGAACDVFSCEPPTKDNPLVTLPNFLATPHIAAATDEALYRVSTSTVKQVLAVLEGRIDDTVRFVP